MIKSPTIKKAFCMILLLAALCTESAARTFYVDQNHSSANDNNPGTLDAPWETLYKATTTAAAGDTVWVRTGVYHESVYFAHAGNSDQGYITFSAFPNETPIIDGQNVNTSSNGVVIDKSYIKFSGFEIRNWGGNAMWITQAAFVDISDCIVHDVFFGIGVADGSHDFTFNNVEVYHFDLYGFDVSPSGGADCFNGTFNDCLAHTGRDPQQNVDGFALGHGSQHSFEFNRCTTHDVYDGFDISSRETTLNGCLAFNCGNGAFKLWQDKVTLINCIGYNSGISNVELDWDGETGLTTLVNCTFYNAQVFSIWIENAADTLHMHNCILSGGDNIGLAFEQVGIKNYMGDYNLFHNDNTSRMISNGYNDEFSVNQVGDGTWTQYSGQDAHSIIARLDTDIFVDPENGDFHLAQNSPAIDKGANIYAPSVDFDDFPRPVGALTDIGAFEFSGNVLVRQNIHKQHVPHTCLLPNYPNPFNPHTTISYVLAEDTPVTISVYDLLGRQVKTLVATYQPAGRYQIIWDGMDKYTKPLASGPYIICLQTEYFTQTQKILYIK